MKEKLFIDVFLVIVLDDEADQVFWCLKMLSFLRVGREPDKASSVPIVPLSSRLIGEKKNM